MIFAEDNYLVREGTSALLRDNEDIELVAAVEDLPSLLEAVEELGPQAVLTDIRMPPSGTTEGIDAAKRIRADSSSYDGTTSRVGCLTPVTRIGSRVRLFSSHRIASP